MLSEMATVYTYAKPDNPEYKGGRVHPEFRSDAGRRSRGWLCDPRRCCQPSGRRPRYPAMCGSPPGPPASRRCRPATRRRICPRPPGICPPPLLGLASNGSHSSVGVCHETVRAFAHSVPKYSGVNNILLALLIRTRHVGHASCSIRSDPRRIIQYLYSDFILPSTKPPQCLSIRTKASTMVWWTKVLFHPRFMQSLSSWSPSNRRTPPARAQKPHRHASGPRNRSGRSIR